MILFLIPIVLILISFTFIVVNFTAFLLKGKTITRKELWNLIELWAIAVVPTVFLAMADLPLVNDCCTDSAIFSPEHRLGIYALLIGYTIAYIVSVFRKKILAPLGEFALNAFLLLGLVLNILFCWHFTTQEYGPVFWIFGNIPIIFLLLIKLAENQKKLTQYIQENGIVGRGTLGKISLLLLKMKPMYKYPVLLLLLVPFIVLLSCFLMLFGQQPDSLIKAFTDTYKHGFSQLDYLCNNVDCGGHFLCSVGANGHKSIVKPIRYGERNGNKIICNRQLLVSNAFEEIIQEKLPKAHQMLRKNYNNIGKLVHRYYRFFNIKLVSDIVYILMKPLEYFFLFILYAWDTKPENRIAMQYLDTKERNAITRKTRNQQNNYTGN